VINKKRLQSPSQRRRFGLKKEKDRLKLLKLSPPYFLKNGKLSSNVTSELVRSLDVKFTPRVTNSISRKLTLLKLKSVLSDLVSRSSAPWRR